MVRLNYSELVFDHLVIFEKDKTVFAVAKYNGDTRLRIFLVYEETGNAYTRNGRADSWEVLVGSDAETVRNKIRDARNNHIPVYTIKGSNTENN
jgi:hypothetical protein